MTPARAGVAVLLVYGLRVPVPRDDHPGFRLTVQPDGAVWVEPVGFGGRTAAPEIGRIVRDCQALGLKATPLPDPALPGFIVSRRS